LRPKTKVHEVYVKYGHLVDFIWLDSAGISRLVGQTPLAVSAGVGEARAGVFLLVVRPLKFSINGTGKISTGLRNRRFNRLGWSKMHSK
jgi:hypothetical protein